jgi:hypothetical protein
VDHVTAEKRAEELRREHPDRLTHTWMARGTSDGEWEVVKVRIPGMRTGPLKSTSEAKPKPPMPEDPRPAPFRDAPPFGAA